jgi:DnaJ-domain-containing protein 1
MPKDYYAILGVTPLATPEELRRSYRRLAMEWHPDRKGGDPGAALRFHELREAYQTLSDPVRKDAWLQERWYLRSMGVRTEQKSADRPVELLKACISYEQELAMTDPHRINAGNILARLRNMMTRDAMEMLLQEKDPEIRIEVCRRLLRCGRHFEPTAARELVRLLEPLTATDMRLSEEAARYLARRRRAHAMERVRIPLLLLATAIACLLIANA